MLSVFLVLKISKNKRFSNRLSSTSEMSFLFKYFHHISKFSRTINTSFYVKETIPAKSVRLEWWNQFERMHLWDFNHIYSAKVSYPKRLSHSLHSSKWGLNGNTLVRQCCDLSMSTKAPVWPEFWNLISVHSGVQLLLIHLAQSRFIVVLNGQTNKAINWMSSTDKGELNDVHLICEFILQNAMNIR